jgi:hypothetical protein
LHTPLPWGSRESNPAGRATPEEPPSPESERATRGLPGVAPLSSVYGRMSLEGSPPGGVLDAGLEWAEATGFQACGSIQTARVRGGGAEPSHEDGRPATRALNMCCPLHRRLCECGS